jgi:hypothetical protein
MKKNKIDEVINLYLSENGYKTEQLEDFLQDKSISFLTKFNLLLHVLMPLPIFFSSPLLVKNQQRRGSYCH